MPTARRGGLLLAVVLACSGVGCRQPAGPAPKAEAAQPAEASPPPASTPRPSVALGSLTIELVRVQRLERDLVQAEFLATNAGPAPVELGRVLSSPAGGLEQAAFTLSSGDIRSFVLHDDRDVPQCTTTLGPVAPGGRLTFFVRFAALSDGAYQGRIELPGVPPLDGAVVPAPSGP